MARKLPFGLAKAIVFRRESEQNSQFCSLSSRDTKSLCYQRAAFFVVVAAFICWAPPPVKARRLNRVTDGIRDKLCGVV